MIKQPFILQNINIKKMPGLPEGLPKFEELAPDINIISGPNASGKSSTARLIQQLIWHNQTHGMEAQASVLLDNNQPWEISIESDKVSLFQDGRADEIPGLPPVEGSHRYWLALQDLVADEDSDTAEAIIRESSGGFDLDEVHKNLNYSATVSNKNTSEFKDLERALNHYRQILNKQEHIKQQEETLKILNDEKAETEHNSHISSFFQKLADYITAQQLYNEASEMLKHFHPSMEHVTGEEWNRIEKFEKAINASQAAIETIKSEIQEKSKKEEQLTIPGNGINSQIIDELEKRISKLSETEREIKNNAKEIEGLKVKSQEYLQAIDEEINTDYWNTPDLKDVKHLDRFLQNAHNILGLKNRLEKEDENLTTELDNLKIIYADPEKLRKAIDVLNSWLTDQKVAEKLPGWVVPAILASGAVTALTTYFAGAWGLTGLLIMTAIWIFARNKPAQQNNTLELRKNDFAKSGLKPPENWHNYEAITGMINNLLYALHDAIQTEETRKKLTARKQEVQNRLQEIQKQYEKLLEAGKSLKEKIQAVPNISEIPENDFSSLAWLLENIKKWQTIHVELESLTSQNQELSNQFDEDFIICNRYFTQFGFTPAEDAVRANSVFYEINKQENVRKELTRSIQQLKKELTGQENVLDNAQKELQEIYDKLNIPPDNKDFVKQLVDQREKYKELKDAFSAKKVTYQIKKQELELHPVFPEFKPEIDHISAKEAELEAREYACNAEKRDAILQQINEIETQVKNLKNGHELEDVLAGKEDAMENLENLYRKNVAGVTGNLIIEQLKAETRDQNRPEVFKRAVGLFNKITAGAYELRLENNHEAAFTALDTKLNREQPLSHLSTGTRVQLLLAVRLAFIEKQENAVKVPILADELLANSDDERASAIIQALMEISRDGRQIFYFTAQHDEVRKWLSFLQNQDELKYKTLKLTGHNETNSTPTEYTISPDEFKLINHIPLPEGKSHAEYGRELEIGPFDIISREISTLHLWYLIEDVDLLAHCLRRGIRHWGQLKSFMKHNGVIPEMGKLQQQIIIDKAELLKRFKELYSLGRSKPVDREILEKSPVAGTKFFEQTWNKLKELNRQPDKLLEAIDNKEIPGFRKAKKHELETFFIENGIIRENHPLPSDEIKIHLQAFVSASSLAPKIAENTLQRVMSLH